ncbi:MAG TPA: DUF1549 domain-containing protein, partial [Flavisolibacter sp.]|nr:DUF1549 domain-containing protein [Flavisolibacter sp.]
MLLKRNRKSIIVVSVLIASITIFLFSSFHSTIDFNTEVKPIFNKKCIICHGGVRQQSEFSLLFRTDAVGHTKSGKKAIVPGDPDHSELIRRINSKDPEDRMPYHHPSLTDKEISILTEWIKQGAKWGNHWAYVPVQQVSVPHPSSSFLGLFSPSSDAWIKNDIDYFILQKLKNKKLSHASEADKSTLLRRVSFDITGLPPSASLAKHFLDNNNNDAYENLVDSLLASAHFGERWASVWLDLARYADTKGYERDAGRSIWRYRDWLIKAFNKDMPYDEFLKDQLAGDLLPNATDDEFIATAFHRNTMTNDEGGTDNEEFRTAAVIDRVNTTWQAVLGTTFACVQCHTHPYDPFKHDEYYKFMAFFNDTRDEDTYADYPLLRHYSTADSFKVIEIKNWLAKNGFHKQSSEVYRFLKTWQPAINSILSDSFSNSELNDTKWLAFRNHAIARLQNVDLDDRSELIYRFTAMAPGGICQIHLNNPAGPVLCTLHFPKTKDWTINKINFPKQKGVHSIYFTYVNPNLKKAVDNGMLFDWFYFTNPLPGQNLNGYDSIN